MVPAVNQIEAHPYFTNDEVRRYGQQHQIATEAWSPIAQGKVLGDPAINEIAQRVGRTPAQVVLRWHIQRGDIVFPKSTTPCRIEENFALFDFELDRRRRRPDQRPGQGREGPHRPEPGQLRLPSRLSRPPVGRRKLPIRCRTPLVGSLDVAGDAGERLGGRFAKLWAASTLSALGSGLATIAAPLFVASRTDDPLVVAAASAVAWLPWLLFALPGGVLVDRVDRRRLMIVIDWSRVAAHRRARRGDPHSAGPAWRCSTRCCSWSTPGRSCSARRARRCCRRVVPRARLERANGWLVGGTTLTQGMIAGPLAGFLFADLGEHPVLRQRGARTRPAPCWSVWSPATTGRRRARPGTRPARARPGRCARRSSKGSAGWSASGCCARWRC